MELRPLTKLEKKRQLQIKIDKNVMLLNCDAIVIFPSPGQFGAFSKPDSG